MSIKIRVLPPGTGGAPCGDCGSTERTRIADDTAALCLGCADRRLRAQRSAEDPFRVDFRCPACGKELNGLPLHPWRKAYERHGVCLDCQARERRATRR